MNPVWCILGFIAVCYLGVVEGRCTLASECDGTGVCGGGSHWSCINHVCECRSHNTSIFTYHSSYHSYEYARASCIRENAMLVKIDSMAKYDLVQHFLNSLSSLSDPWIGLRLDETKKPNYEYHFADGKVATFFRWDTANGEPNHQGRDYCIRLTIENNQMRTSACSGRHSYICEKVDEIVCQIKSDCQYKCAGAREYHCVDKRCSCGPISG